MAIAIRVGLLAFLAGHFLLTVAYLTPPNPLKASPQSVLDATIGTYFEQDWSLFAPSPRSSNQALLARPLTDLEVAEIPGRGLPRDGWYDITSPLEAEFAQNRFSGYERLGRPVYRAVVAYIAGDPGLTPWQRSCERGDPASCVIFEARQDAARAASAALLARIGSAFANDMPRFDGDAELTHVALRAREVSRVPWEERYSPKPSVQDVELGVYPIDRSVAAPGLYRTARSG